MRVVAVLLALVLAVNCERECHIPHHDSGSDAGPAINAAFKRCARHGKVVLDDFYTVDTLLFTTNLTDVEIEFSGTSKCYALFISLILP